MRLLHGQVLNSNLVSGISHSFQRMIPARRVSAVQHSVAAVCFTAAVPVTCSFAVLKPACFPVMFPRVSFML